MADDQVWHAIDRLTSMVTMLGPRAPSDKRGKSLKPEKRTAPPKSKNYDLMIGNLCLANLMRLAKENKKSGQYNWSLKTHNKKAAVCYGYGYSNAKRRELKISYVGTEYIVVMGTMGLYRVVEWNHTEWKYTKGNEVIRFLNGIFPWSVAYSVSSRLNVLPADSGTSLGKEMQYTRNDGSVCKVDVEDGVKTHIDSDDGEEYELESVSSGESEYGSDDGTQEGEGSSKEYVRAKRRHKDTEEEEYREEGEEEDEEDVDSDG